VLVDKGREERGVGLWGLWSLGGLRRSLGRGCRRGRIERGRLSRLGWRGLRGRDGLEVGGYRAGVEVGGEIRERTGIEIGRRRRERGSIVGRDAARGSECRFRLGVRARLERERIGT